MYLAESNIDRLPVNCTMDTPDYTPKDNSLGQVSVLSGQENGDRRVAICISGYTDQSLSSWVPPNTDVFLSADLTSRQARFLAVALLAAADLVEGGGAMQG